MPRDDATPIALTIAGSDSSGGAGILADLKTFSAFGVYGACVVTALTAQNTRGVTGVHPVPPEFVSLQIEAVLSDLSVGAIKTGMLATREITLAVAAALGARRDVPLVVDPVMVATSGNLLIAPDAVAALRSDMLPLATLITPNLAEAARLLDDGIAASEAEAEAQARALLALGPRAVLVKGGHGTGAEAVDFLASAGARDVMRLARPRLGASNTHGTGCTLSSAIAALMAQGVALEDAVTRAKDFVWKAIEAGQSLRVGHGHGPVDHLFAIKRQPPPS